MINGSRLKELRKKAGLSAEAAAGKLSISASSYRKYEREEREPSLEVLAELADLFNCSVDYLIERSDEMIDESVLDKALSIDQDLLEKAGNLLEGRRLQELRDNSKDKSYIYRMPIGDILTFAEMEHITKYSSLDHHGKEAVDSILDVEYRRCTEKTEIACTPLPWAIPPVEESKAIASADVDTHSLEEPPADESMFENVPKKDV